MGVREICARVWFFQEREREREREESVPFGACKSLAAAANVCLCLSGKSLQRRRRPRGFFPERYVPNAAAEPTCAILIFRTIFHEWHAQGAPASGIFPQKTAEFSYFYTAQLGDGGDGAASGATSERFERALRYHHQTQPRALAPRLSKRYKRRN